MNPPDNVSTLARTKQRSLHAVLVKSLINTRALRQRLEAGVSAPPGEAREAVRELYLQVRRTVQVLSWCLELPDLE
jgi:hypothetical protein